MSDLDRLQDAFLKADALAEQGDAEAAADAKMFADEIRRLQAGGGSSAAKGPGFMAQLNTGIAETAGGLVDLLNPFDAPLYEGAPSTGSAVTGIRNVMDKGGIRTTDQAPQSIVEGIGRGVGNAAAAMVPVGKGVDMLSKAPGMVGQVARTIAPGMFTKAGASAEVVAGGAAGGAMTGAEQAGAPPWVQSIAGLVGGIAVPAIGAAVNAGARAAGKGAQMMPVTGAVIQAGKDVVRAIAPMSKAGAMEVAKRRVQDLAGGPQRADELARMIDPNDPLARTPAEQTGDPNLLGLQRAAAEESPLLRERLASRDAETRARAEAEIKGMGGDVKDAKAFFTTRVKDFKSALSAKVDEVIKMGNESVQGVAPYASETTNSSAMVGKIKGEMESQLKAENALWRAIPKGTKLDMTETRAAIAEIIDGTPWAQRRDVPDDLRKVLDPNGPLGTATSGAELHGLYSEMRRIARVAMTGTAQNKNTARIANDVAEAILKDLGAVDGSTDIGRKINDARAFSRALHETFDTGAVGRILNRTIDGDETIPSEAAMARTVGRGGASAVADEGSIVGAAPDTRAEIADYVRGRFMDAAVDASGKFTPSKAATFLRDNREMLAKYPELSAELRRALSSRSAADTFAAKTEARMKLADQSSAAEFNKGQDALLSILKADDPSQASRSVAATARKDKTGKALAGVKGAFTDFLIGKAGTDAGLSGEKLTALLKDGRTRVAIRQIFGNVEAERIETIAKALAKAEAPTANVGQVIDSPANRMLEYIVRMTAARVGGQAGGGTMGGSLQTANIATERARSILRGMTNNTARQMLMDAMEDPELYRTLLMSPQAIAASKTAQSRLAPYLTGTAAATGTDDRFVAKDAYGRPLPKPEYK